MSWATPSGAVEGFQHISSNLEDLPRPTEKPESLKQFFKERTILAVGFAEVFNDNVFLKDNNPQEDFLTYLEAQTAFVDPRGTILYGLTYEVNAFRYHRQNKSALDHDFRSFFDFDPGGRYKFESNYKLVIQNSLVLGPAAVDIIRRSTDFQRMVEHTWNAKYRYALNDTNSMVPQAEYSIFDDQSANDADTDRRKLKAILDLDHDLRPDWTLYGGYELNKVTMPLRKLKSSESHGVRLGIRHQLTKAADLDLLAKFEHRVWRSNQQSNNLSFSGRWNYEAGPRTKLLLGYEDERIPSYSAGRLQFRSTRPSLGVQYDLTPLTKFAFGANYEKQRSGGRDVLTGQSAATSVSSRYELKTGIDWQFREKGHITLDYSFARSRTNDYTNHMWVLGLETEL